MSELKLYEYSNTKNPKYLVMILHGYGANGENLIDLAHEFKHTLPEAHFISPNAVEPWEGGFPNSYQWFSLASGFDANAMNLMANNIKKSQQTLGKLIDDQLALLKLKPENLFLIGFSQGAMMALYQAFIRPQKIAGVIAFSGRLVLPEMFGEKTISKPDTCLIHGESDAVVPFTNFLEAKKILEEQNFPLESHAIPNLGHSIDRMGTTIAKDFFTRLTQGNL